MTKVTNIPSRLHSVEQGNIVAGANEIYDDTKGKKQNVINSETDAELLRLEQSKQDNLTFDNAPTENSNNPVKSGGVYAADLALQQAIEAILLLIPSAATSLNQLADKAFVNSSISTATATFRGTYNVVTDLHLAVDATHAQIETALASVVATADNNDYCYVQIPVSSSSQDIQKTSRYKFNGTAWVFEYDLNTSGFTSAQWAAINSGITAALVTKLGDLPTATEISNQFNAITNLIPSEATALNQLADKAYVAAKILAATPAFKGQFTTLADLQAVASPKAGDLGIVRTKDSDGHDVFTFYQYLSNAWNVYYTLSNHLQNKPATTGTSGDYPYNGMGRVVLPMNIKEIGGVTANYLEQSMMPTATGGNTIYVITHDYVLASEITIPANSVMEFEGGSISGEDKVTFDKTILIGNVNITCDFGGIVRNSEIDISWFGCQRSFDDVTQIADCSGRLQLCVDLAADSQCGIFVPIGDFKIDNTVYLRTGTIMKGVHGYTFKRASRFFTTVQNDSFVMFRQKDNQGDLDAIRHCTFEGITFLRDRTAAERAGGIGDGEGYGLAGTLFKGFTELRLLNCGVIGFGKVFNLGAICFCDNTDFAYTGTIVEGGKEGESGTTAIQISHSNIWACGDLVKGYYYGIDELVISNSWIEYAESFYSGDIATKLTNFVVENVWFTNVAYTSPHLIKLTGTVNANTPTFLFKNCSIKNKGQICNSVNAATSVNVHFDDCYMIYGGDYSLETCNIYGNSILRDIQNDYNLIGRAANSGIDTKACVTNYSLIFKKQANNAPKGEYGVFRTIYNTLSYFNENNKDVRILDAYPITGQNDTVADATQDVYFMFNGAPASEDNILVLRSKGLNKSFVLADNIPIYGSGRPSRQINGRCFFDTTIMKPIWVVRNQFGQPYWVDANGLNPQKAVGVYADRPSTGVSVGTSYFATDKGVEGVGAMIYYTGDATTPWVYSDGSAVVENI